MIREKFFVQLFLHLCSYFLTIRQVFGLFGRIISFTIQRTEYSAKLKKNADIRPAPLIRWNQYLSFKV